MNRFVIAAAVGLMATASQAQEIVTYQTGLSFDDATFGIESAIVDAGLVIDSVSHVGEMLERTKGDVGSDVDIFADATVFSFCSATVSRQVMEANPMNIVYCPYGIFVAELADKPGQAIVGFRKYPDGAMQQVQALLDGIVQAALEE